MIKILFICHGRILKYSGKACKINDFTVQNGAYYTTITPFLKSLEMTRKDRREILEYEDKYTCKSGDKGF